MPILGSTRRRRLSRSASIVHAFVCDLDILIYTRTDPTAAVRGILDSGFSGDDDDDDDAAETMLRMEEITVSTTSSPKGYLHGRVRVETRHAIERIAAAHGLSVSELVRRLAERLVAVEEQRRGSAF